MKRAGFCARISVRETTLSSARASLVHETDAARSRIAESQMRVDGAEGITPAHEWIKSHPPQTQTPEEASATLLQITRSAAEEAGLKIVEENLLPAAATANVYLQGLLRKVAYSMIAGILTSVNALRAR